MQAWRLHGAADARLDEIPEPEVTAGGVKVRVACSGICGSDLSLYETAPVPVDWPHPLVGQPGPHVLGHEFAGYVTEVGAGVDGIPVGALVAVQPSYEDGTCAACLRGEPNLCEQFGFLGVNGGGGGFAEYVVATADKVFVLPAGFTPETGALVEPLSVALHAVRLSGIAAGQTALVVGGGPIGLGLLLCLKAQGAQRVIVSEMSAARRELAAALGADVVDPRETDLGGFVRELTSGLGVDASFDAAGAGQATFDSAVDALRKGGTSVVVAMYHEGVNINPSLLMITEKRVTGSFAYTRDDFRTVIDMVADGRLDPAPLITSRIQLADALEKGIHALQSTGRETEVKILVTQDLDRS
ncbi:alcohol dehydrogenase catalytic domain-containing protein [Mycobacterium sp. CBMA293]|uniref:zinc-binding dehydrogenase n=1 Tax=unclassified Mycolicibacterium TaxID=2636767 RepID=UPI0012DFB0EA|nr:MULTISPECIES: zinc-binding dehydrogenase [unclassified Mycolicibacterium]MUL47395.1 alcohol dehydrogenase catalytic domain-containing protein [Mycolicibacterium sp. CBMA 360]MUL59380.1 alcohol dehydrogenase catalytic domain-containing protein [Mycolicibacterium sp. CBMA 335]MUL71105.1 alcohol dehydrogenase catalytic domain-containing protein [Mycolicibacterium sp. CBMA 311]MUL94748.1 alcohol dehydrogenase catalytic domain-containing protein [Mycolicibacterium sp. CBMA 230]MUM09071.1 zinc-bi